MGASKSKTAADIINEVAAQVLISNANNCSASLTGIQIVRTSGLTLGQLNYASMRLTQSCIQNITITNDVIDKITDAIDQQAKAKVTALLPGGAFANSTTKIRNAVSTNITNSTIQNAMANLQFGQDISTSGVTIGQANIISGDIALKAMQTAVAKTNLARDLGANVGQATSAETDTSPISQLFSGIWGYIIILVVIFVIIIGGIAALKYFSSSKEPDMIMDTGDDLTEPIDPNVMMDENGNLVSQDTNDALNPVMDKLAPVADIIIDNVANRIGAPAIEAL